MVRITGNERPSNGCRSRTIVNRFLEHRIGDRRIIRLIQKWLKAGVLEAGAVSVSDKGTGQGAVISPLLAQYLPALRARSVGRTLETAQGQG